MKTKFIKSLVLGLLSNAFALAQEITLDPLQRTKIEALVKRDVPENAPGVAFGIVQNGEIIYTQYEGFANLEQSLNIEANTRFNIASNAKQYTALAILTLIEEKKLSLEDDLRKFFPHLFSNIKEKIQIKHLLTHTSGIRDFYDLLALQNITWWKITLDNQKMIALLANQTALNFKPGSKYLYSNSNYILLAEIVSKVTNQPFSAYLNQLFKQLEMPHTHFESDHTNIKEPIAKPYFNFSSWTSYDWMWNVVGDGNLFTTLPDQLRFEQYLQGYQSDFLRKKTIKKLQKKILKKFNYGYGVEFSEYKDNSILFHHGSTGAWKATFMRFPRQKLALMTLSNSGKTDVIDQNQKIAAILLNLNQSEKNLDLIAPENIGNFVEDSQILGIYQDNFGTTFQFVKKEDGIYLVRNGRNDVRLVRENNNIFHQEYDPAFKQEFKKNKQNKWTITAYHSSHSPYTLTKVESDFSGFAPTSLEGEYFNEEISTTIKIILLTDKKYQINIGTYESEGILLTKTKMLVNSYTFNFDKNQNIYLDGQRIKNMLFVKKR